MMAKPTLQILKDVTVWLGAAVTLSGIVFNVASGGSRTGNALSLVGLLLTCLGHYIASAISTHQTLEKQADQAKISELYNRVEYAEEMLNDPDLKRMLQAEAWRYAEEHQDDGR